MNSAAYKLYTIDNNVYLELKWFCRQYADMCHQLVECYGVSGVSYESTGEARGNRTSDPTAVNGEKALRIRADIDMIDEALRRTTDEPLQRFVKKRVTEGIPYERLGEVPCGRRQFYELCRKFFWILAQIRKKG